MRSVVIALLLFAAACQNSETDSMPDDSVVHVDIVRDSVKEEILEAGVWAYFSKNTFEHDNFQRGMISPYAVKQLSELEIRTLDSVLLVASKDTTHSIKAAMCYWPKHGILVRDSAGAERIVNICFECNKSRSDDTLLRHVSLELWEMFFLRIELPVKSGYQEFFDRGYMDSAFRSQFDVFYYH